MKSAISITGQELYSPKLNDFFNFLIEEHERKNGLLSLIDNGERLNSYISHFLLKLMDEGWAKSGRDGAVYVAGEFPFAFPILRKQDLVVTGELKKMDQDTLFEVLDYSVQTLKQYGAIEYAKLGGGMVRMDTPPPEAFVYEDHNGILSGHNKDTAYAIFRKSPPYSDKAKKILKEYDLL